MIILGGDGDAGAEKQLFLLQSLHRLHGALEHAMSASFIGGRVVAFYADDGNHVEMGAQEFKVSRPNECACSGCCSP